MKRLAMVLVLVMFFGIGTAIAEDERHHYPGPNNEQFIVGVANINDVELVRQKGCIADFDLFYEDLLFTGLRGVAPLQICDALWVSGITEREVFMKLAYRFNPLRVRVVRIALFNLEGLDD